MNRPYKDCQPSLALDAVFELDDDLHTLFCGPLLCIVFRFCKRLRSQNFCDIYFVDGSVYKIGRHCTALEAKASRVWLCGRGERRSALACMTKKEVSHAHRTLHDWGTG